MLKYSFLIVCCIALGFIHPAFADRSAEAELTSILQPLKRFSAKFRQRIENQQGELVEEVEGRIVISRPGRAYWKTENPYAQTIVSDGETLWRYDADLEQLTVGSMQRYSDAITTTLLGGEMQDIKRHFAIEYGMKKNRPQKNLFIFHPREKNGIIQRVEIRFRRGVPVSLRSYNSLGHLTTVLFRRTKKNPRIDPDFFRFDPPPNTDVIFEE